MLIRSRPLLLANTFNSMNRLLMRIHIALFRELLVTNIARNRSHSPHNVALRQLHSVNRNLVRFYVALTGKLFVANITRERALSTSNNSCGRAAVHVLLVLA